MKKLVMALTFCILCSGAAWSAGNEKTTVNGGDFWDSMERNEKFSYLVGCYNLQTSLCREIFLMNIEDKIKSEGKDKLNVKKEQVFLDKCLPPSDELEFNDAEEISKTIARIDVAYKIKKYRRFSPSTIALAFWNCIKISHKPDERDLIYCAFPILDKELELEEE